MVYNLLNKLLIAYKVMLIMKDMKEHDWKTF